MALPLVTLNLFANQISLIANGLGLPKVYAGPNHTVAEARAAYQATYGFACNQTDATVTTILTRVAGFVPDAHIVMTTIAGMYQMDSLAGTLGG